MSLGMCLFPFLELTLTLLMARIGANDAHNTLATDDAAIFANATDGTANFHSYLLLPCSKKETVLNHNRTEKSREYFCFYFLWKNRRLAHL